MTSLINASIAAAEVSRLDKLGYIPVVGTVSGCCRMVYGVAKAVTSAASYVFSTIVTGSGKRFGYHFTDGLLHVGRGFIELFPFVGGAILQKYDRENEGNRAAQYMFSSIYETF
jgi:hypothetical protein